MVEAFKNDTLDVQQIGQWGTIQIQTAVISEDEQTLAIGTSQGAYLFDIPTETYLHTISVGQPATKIAWHPSRPILAIGADALTIWNTDTGELIQHLHSQPNQTITKLEFSADGEYLLAQIAQLSGEVLQAVYLWDIQTWSSLISHDSCCIDYEVAAFDNDNHLGGHGAFANEEDDNDCSTRLTER